MQLSKDDIQILLMALNKVQVAGIETQVRVVNLFQRLSARLNELENPPAPGAPVPVEDPAKKHKRGARPSSEPKESEVKENAEEIQGHQKDQ